MPRPDRSKPGGLRLHTLVRAAALAGAPALVVTVTVRLLLGAGLLDFRPYLNDEVYYWHQTATAATAGLDGGYYTVEELTPAVGLFRFGPHGPVYPLLTGIAARIAGWHRASAPLFNMAWLAAAAIGYLVLARPPAGRAWLAAVLLATMWPVAFWAASNMQESVHHGFALVLAGALLAIGRGSRPARLIAWPVLILAILIRPSWAVVLPGLFAVSMGRRTPVRVAAAGAVSALILAAALAVYGRVAAPLPGAFEFLRLARLEDGFAPIVSNARANLQRLADLGDDYDPLEIVHRVEYLALAAALVAAALWRRRDAPETGARLHLAVQASQLGAIVVAMIAFYALTNWTEHRVISAHLLMAALVLAALPVRFAVVAAALLAAANVAVIGIYAESFRQNRYENFVWDRRPLRVFEETIDGTLKYAPDAPPWCNTLLSSQYPPDFIAVPPGIGISITRSPDELAAPPKSRYLLLDPEATDALAGRARMTPVGAPLPYGQLFINQDARCLPESTRARATRAPGRP